MALIAARLNAEIILVVTATSWALVSVLKTSLMNDLLFLLFVIFNTTIINVVHPSHTSCGRPGLHSHLSHMVFVSTPQGV